MATIYKISCRDSEIKDCYVGSTEHYNKRCENHKSNCYNTNIKEYNYKVYTFIRANEGFSNFIIEPIYECNVEDRYIEEQRWFELLKPTLNSQYPNRSIKEWYIDNKQKILEHKKQYRENNKQQISEKNKHYRENNKQKISEYKKQYRENNKNYFKDYRENNKQELLEKAKIKIECECGSKFRKSDKARHLKTTKHQKLINSKL
tara:strand:- start:120 stop:731 length:612 start_codon:yes stop_codon:yes gene_type:complete